MRLAYVWHACGIPVKSDLCHLCVMARDDLHFRLRIPEGLKAKIEQSATVNRRSMTAEIIARLEATFESGETVSEAQPDLRKLVKLVVHEVLETLGEQSPTPTKR